jgi:hypothetical protein
MKDAVRLETHRVIDNDLGGRHGRTGELRKAGGTGALSGGAARSQPGSDEDRK